MPCTSLGAAPMAPPTSASSPLPLRVLAGATADVLVIGAGMAGLSAACELRDRGLSVVVLEGRERVGGRLLTDHSLDARQGVDLGGAWIHGTGAEGGDGRNPVFGLAQKYGVALHPTDFHNATTFGPTGARLGAGEVLEHGCLYARFEAFLLNLTAAAAAAAPGHHAGPFSTGPLPLAHAPPLPAPPHPLMPDLHMLSLAACAGSPASPQRAAASSADGLVLGVPSPALLSPQLAAGAAAGPRAGRPPQGCHLSVQAVMDLFVAQAGLDAGQAACLAFQVHSNVEHYWAGDVADMAAGVFAEQMFEGDDVLFPQGYNQLTGALAQGLDIRLGHAVSAIDYGQPGVRVTTTRGVFTARYAVVTLPLGVLKSGRVRFNPPLASADPPKAIAIQRLGAATYNKTVLLFDAPFWDDTDILLRIPAGDAERGQWSVFLNLHRVLGAPILVGFNLGANARALERQSDAATVAAALHALRGAYGAAAVPEPRRAVITRWGQDPFSLMSYSYLPVGATLADFDALRAPVPGGRLFFAGEACSSAYFGTVHGAHITGLAAAREVAAMAAVTVGPGGWVLGVGEAWASSVCQAAACGVSLASAYHVGASVPMASARL